MRVPPFVAACLAVLALSACTASTSRLSADAGAYVQVRTDGGTDAGWSDSGTGPDGGIVHTPLPVGRLRIAMWCGPPAAFVSQARIDEAAAAGFTTMSNACDNTTSGRTYNELLLAFSADAGMDAILSDARIEAALGGANVAANLDGVVSDYANAPGLAGYFVGDEPNAGSFGAIAALETELKSRDPLHFAYTNLLPAYASGAQLGSASYSAYVHDFLATVKPALVSWDYYPFLLASTDVNGFFSNMETVRTAAIATDTPFFQFIQSITFNGHRTTTQAEKLWVAMQTLAYGGKGISWFTYWTPPQTGEAFGPALIDGSGHQTAQYAQAQAINAKLAALGRYLVPAKSTAVFHNGLLPSGTVPRAPGDAVYVPSPAPVTVGLFSVNDEDVYALVTNRDAANAVSTDLVLAATASAPEMLDVGSGKFSVMQTLSSTSSGNRVHVSLPPAEGVLIHLKGPLLATPAGPEAYVVTVRADQGTLDVVDSAFGDATVGSLGWGQCPRGYTLAGQAFASNGFFVCARTDLLPHTFYLGNVVSDGAVLYALAGGTAVATGAAGWDQCPAGKLLGHRFESNGFWLCMQ